MLSSSSFSTLTAPADPPQSSFSLVVDVDALFIGSSGAVTLFALVGRQKSREQHQSSHHLNVNFSDHKSTRNPDESASKTEPQQAFVLRPAMVN